jgi:hypothetical protein
MATYGIMSTNSGWDGVFTSGVLGLVDFQRSNMTPKNALISYVKTQHNLDTPFESYEDLVNAGDEGDEGQYFVSNEPLQDEDEGEPFSNYASEAPMSIVEAYNYAVKAWLAVFDEYGDLQVFTIVELE